MENLNKNIDNLSQNLFKELSETRRYFNKHPELSRQEYHTSEYIRNKIAMVGKTAFTADLVQSKSYPWVALRADMDAHPIRDENDLSCKSVNRNIPENIE
jgi:metal-dependent amidase/aminoacylase/carboxypeptidase family protein